ncbi:dynein axonemal intermediate chain 4-like [Symphorus nematophorus]
MVIRETDTITLLDIPSTIVSQDADDAAAIKDRNIQYVELCKTRMGNDKYVARSSQTFNGEKNQQTQTEEIVMKDKGTVATVWDISDSYCEQKKTPKGENADNPESSANTSKGQEKRGEKSSGSSKGSTINALSKMDMHGNSLNTEPDPQLIMLSESFQDSLLVMERSIALNIFQPKLAAYRQLPILEDPDSTVKPGTKEQDEEGEESSSSPTLERLWAFSCKLTRGRTITSMAWNKKNPDILAVGYGDCDPSNGKPSLICCWTIKNIMWPERVIHCHSCVTSLDFSASDPSQLAVGMYDGTVAIYSVWSQNQKCIANSSDCSEKHLQPVRQVIWTQQDERLSGEDKEEALVSVSADGRITKWALGSNGLDCIDLMVLKRSEKKTKKPAGDKKKAERVLSTLTPGVCVDFHPTCPVNQIEWSPFSSDVFLSCSSDWTIQLWKQDCSSPVLSFTSTQKAVYGVRWSPNWSTIFAAVKANQVEIWDLNSEIEHPIIVHHAVPGVSMMSLLFARGTDCVLVGDSDGQVTVYKLKNLSVGEGKQGNSLDDIIHAAASRRSKK